MKIILTLLLVLLSNNAYAGLVKNTNCAFVTVAPSVDPADASSQVSGASIGFKDTTVSNANLVNEIGWWCDTASDEQNYEVAIYSHDSTNNRPNAIIGSDITNAKGTTAGWKSCTGLSISISGSTIYWIGFQLDNSSPNTSIDRVASTGEKYDVKLSSSALPNPWGTSDVTWERIIAIYAVYTTSGGATLPPSNDVFGIFDAPCYQDCFGVIQ